MSSTTHKTGAAIEAIARAQGKPTGAELAAVIGVSYETLRRWRKGTAAPNRQRQQVIADYLGVPPSAFMFPPPAVNPASAFTGQSGETHHASGISVTIAPTTIAWTSLMLSELPSEFQTYVPDDSMEPDVMKGARVFFSTELTAAPGDYVLIADADNRLHFREYKTVRGDRWEAHAKNGAYLPLDSERDGLRVLAVFDGVRGRRAHV